MSISNTCTRIGHETTVDDSAESIHVIDVTLPAVRAGFQVFQICDAGSADGCFVAIGTPRRAPDAWDLFCRKSSSRETFVFAGPSCEPIRVESITVDPNRYRVFDFAGGKLTEAETTLDRTRAMVVARTILESGGCPVVFSPSAELDHEWCTVTFTEVSESGEAFAAAADPVECNVSSGLANYRFPRGHVVTQFEFVGVRPGVSGVAELILITDFADCVRDSFLSSVSFHGYAKLFVFKPGELRPLDVVSTDETNWMCIGFDPNEFTTTWAMLHDLESGVISEEEFLRIYEISKDVGELIRDQVELGKLSFREVSV